MNMNEANPVPATALMAATSLSYPGGRAATSPAKGGVDVAEP